MKPKITKKVIIAAVAVIVLLLIAPRLQTRAFAQRHGEVWVNTRTGVWHEPDDEWYGNTVSGLYLPSWAARMTGARASREWPGRYGRMGRTERRGRL